MKNPLKMKTVDDVMQVFTKAIDDLEAIESAQEEKKSLILEQERHLIAKRESVTAEIEKARSMKVNLKSLFKVSE